MLQGDRLLHFPSATPFTTLSMAAALSKPLGKTCAILDEAKKEGVVCIKKRDGETFFLKPAPPKKSPLDVKGVDLGLSSAEIVDVIRKGRERQYDS